MYIHGENKFTNKVKCDTGNDLQTDVLITTRWSMMYRIWTGNDLHTGASSYHRTPPNT